MNISHRAIRSAVVRMLYSALLLAVLCHAAHAQAAAEAAGATSMSAAAAASAKPIKLPNLPTASSPATSSPGSASHIVSGSSGPPADEINRRALAESAGKNAGKLLLRSNLPNSRVWIGGKFVGKTPLLLIVAPGKYQLEAQGPNSESTQDSVALMPHETREVVLKLEPRYPARVKVH